MEALGFIETKGLIGAIESADVMLKAADVVLVDRTFVTGGLVAITVTGDVAAVKAAVDAAAAAVSGLDGAVLVSTHVIPRPHQDIESLVIPLGSPIESQCTEVMPMQEDPTPEPQELEPAQTVDDKQKVELNKTEVDKLALESGSDKVIGFLEKQKVVDLRHLAREYEALDLTSRAISRANKEQLLSTFKNYYKK